MKEMQSRYVVQVLEDHPQTAGRLASDLITMGRIAREKWDRLNEQIRTETDPRVNVLLLVKRNAVGQTLADVSELLRDIREHMTPAKDAAA